MGLIEDHPDCAVRQAMKMHQLPHCLAAADLQSGRCPDTGHNQCFRELLLSSDVTAGAGPGIMYRSDLNSL
jgi:hypothetical protein